jgi:3-hydroxybutyryl-CoA dehydrogenase
MGHGIAHVSAVAGYDVTLFDVDERSVRHGIKETGRSLDSGVGRGKLNQDQRDAAMARVVVSLDLEDAVGSADVVIEAVPEKLELKQSLFARISRAAPFDALLATNTSSLSISEIAAGATAPERILGMHFFNPVTAMKLVEIVRGKFTSDEAIVRAREFAGSIGKTSIVVGDSPGFATSRLGIVLGLEAMRMLEQGVATADDIDLAMQLGYNHPVGPLKLTDIVGLDVRLAVADHLLASFGDATYRAPDILRRKVAAGELGRKTGRGFYAWPPIDKGSPEPLEGNVDPTRSSLQ